MGSDKVETLLQNLKNLLLKEKECIIKAINDTKSTEELNRIVEEKHNILMQLAQFKVEDFKGYEDLVYDIQQLSRTNMILAESNLKFIESVFESIFEQTSTYLSDGQVKSKSSGIINKKA